jgi:hypothetical protein
VAEWVVVEVGRQGDRDEGVELLPLLFKELNGRREDLSPDMFDKPDNNHLLIPLLLYNL